MSIRVFRVKRLFMGLGIVVILLGIALALIPGIHYFTGTPMMIGGRRGGTTHVASEIELGQLVLESLAMVLLGLPFLVYYKLASVTLDMDGIIVVDGIGRTTFRACYDEIQSVGPIQQGNKQRTFLVKSEDSKVTITDNVRDFETLQSLLIERSNLQRSIR